MTILVAGAAMASGLARAAARHGPGPIHWALYADACCLAIALSWAVVLIRLAPPRPAPGRRFRPPGVAACFVAAAVHTFTTIFRSADAFARAHSLRAGLEALAPQLMLPYPTAAAVAATWMAMLADRRWRPEASWVDRLGRLAGASWILLAVAYPLLSAWVLLR